MMETQMAPHTRHQPESSKEACRVIYKGATQDCLFLCLIVLLSLILYVQGLGFYHDDWAFWAVLSTSRDQSLSGLCQTLYSRDVNLRQRPVQILYLAGLYRLFGLHPLGYHLINAAVLLASIVLSYLVLRELGQPRFLSLTLPMVYALLPHYSTDRFWIAAFQATLSITLYFLGLYAVLRALRSPAAHIWGWKLLSLLSLLGSGLAYEVVLPLFLLTPVLIWRRTRQRYDWFSGNQSVRVKAAVFLGSPLLVAVLVAGYKLSTTVRMAIEMSYPSYIADLAIRMLKGNFGIYGLGLPYIAWQILIDYRDWTIIGVDGVLGLVIFGYLVSIVSHPATTWPRIASWLKLIVVGLVVFGLGYAIFLTTTRVSFASIGGSNRVAIAAALGVAMSFIGVLGWISALLPPDRFRRRAFCLLVTLLCMCGFLITNTDAAFWVKAYRQQQVVLDGIREEFPALSPNSTLILDGVCPFIGPAAVFISSWDLAGALITYYHDPTLQADVVTPDLQIEEGRLIKLYHGKISGSYPYDEKVILYNFERKMIYQLANVEMARAYFRKFNPYYNSRCAQGFSWRGKAATGDSP
jgi:hypothetical protein